MSSRGAGATMDGGTTVVLLGGDAAAAAAENDGGVSCLGAAGPAAWDCDGRRSAGSVEVSSPRARLWPVMAWPSALPAPASCLGVAAGGVAGASVSPASAEGVSMAREEGAGRSVSEKQRRAARLLQGAATEVTLERAEA